MRIGEIEEERDDRDQLIQYNLEAQSEPKPRLTGCLWMANLPLGARVDSA